MLFSHGTRRLFGGSLIKDVPPEDDFIRFHTFPQGESASNTKHTSLHQQIFTLLLYAPIYINPFFNFATVL